MASANRFARNFFRTSSHCQRREKYYISLHWWIQRLDPLVSKQTRFSSLLLSARVFKWGRKREKQRKRKLGLAPSRLASLSERHTGKAKQITNWSASTFKGKLKFYRYKIVKYKPRAFNRKIEIKPIPILLNISRTITQEARVALGYRLGQLLRFFRALQTSRVLHNSIVHAKAWTNC